MRGASSPAQKGSDLKHIASTFALALRRGAVKLPACAVALAAAVLLAPAAANAATAPPTVATSFPTSPIVVDSGLGQGIGTVVYTVTDPNASGTLYNVSFTDTLPAGVGFETPVTESDTNCSSSTASAPIVTWTITGSTITVNAPQVKAGAACQVQFPIIGLAAGTGSDSYTAGSFAYSTSSTGTPVSTSTATTSASIQVIPEPTVTVQGLEEGAKLNYGESVKVTYSCSQPALPYALTSCTATDDLGNTISSGGKLDTKVPGAHTLDVEVIDAAGDIVDDDIDYTVLANNAFTITKVKNSSGGVLRFTLALPGAGKIKVTEVDGKVTFGKDTTTVRGKKTLKVTIRPTKAGLALLAKGTAKIKLEVTYTPTGGEAKAISKRGIKLS